MDHKHINRIHCKFHLEILRGPTWEHTFMDHCTDIPINWREESGEMRREQTMSDELKIGVPNPSLEIVLWPWEEVVSYDNLHHSMPFQNDLIYIVGYCIHLYTEECTSLLSSTLRDVIIKRLSVCRLGKLSSHGDTSFLEQIIVRAWRKYETEEWGRKNSCWSSQVSGQLHFFVYQMNA